MRVIPVIDLLYGQVVRGVAGRRSEYRPIESQIAADARPSTVAQAIVQMFGFDLAYVADLDAIVAGRPDVASWRQLAAAGLRLWLDAGIGTASAAAQLRQRLAQDGIEARLVIGLESLESERELLEIVEQCPEQPPIFSLDLREGAPLAHYQAWGNLSPLALALRAYAAGIRDIIVLDLADVGTGGGTRTLDLCEAISTAADFDQIIAGGGVRGSADLTALASAGCNAALVASALHDGRLTREAIGRLPDG